ncbi:WXG100 family type VII secretion target [Amycolatopsis sp. cmx-4-54]|uniref:WXG100 family type VII secretion target n=1 Tax=Amycolatopsis sp. cmx-4-54 TaxID=2790936 RepID=UPI00397C51F9
MTSAISAPPEYPQVADAKIREFANLPFIGRPDILQLLDDVRDRLLGNPARIDEMAFRFAKNNAMREAHGDIGAAVQSLAGTWSGRAAGQFTAYASNVTNALEKEQEAVAGVSGFLVEVRQIVVDTYAAAIEFLGICAGRLATIDVKALIAAAATVVPGLNAIMWSDVIDTIVEALGTLVESFVKLIADAAKQMSGFVGAAVGFEQLGTNFAELPDLPTNTGMDNQKQWKIEPDAVPE